MILNKLAPAKHAIFSDSVSVDLDQEKVIKKLLRKALILTPIALYFLYSLCSIGEIPSFKDEGFFVMLFSYFILVTTLFVFVLILISTGGVAIFNFVRYFKYKAMSPSEWSEFIRTQRPALSMATYKHPQTNDIQRVRRGFSLPVYLFGGFVPLFKGQMDIAGKFFLIIIGAVFIGSIIPVLGNIILPLFSSFGIAQKYNHFYENDLINKGYRLESVKMA